MFGFSKKFGFTLSEVMVTLGLIGAIAALTIPTLAYNHKSKVLEQQFRTTYSDIKQISSMLNVQRGDVGELVSTLSVNDWASTFMAMSSGANQVVDNPTNVTDELRNLYKAAGSQKGPFAFELTDGKVSQTNMICDDSSIWVDSKGRIWTFNDDGMICVDVNGTANPNRYNIDIFVFMPISAANVANHLYNDLDNINNYSGTIVLCNGDEIIKQGLTGDVEGMLAAEVCPFTNPVENIPAGETSAKGKTISDSDTYWKKYIGYQ